MVVRRWHTIILKPYHQSTAPKNSIEVGNAAELMTVLSAVKTAVEAGDLDAQIDSASAAVRERFAQ